MWDSEVEAASAEGRDIAEDYLNEWELELEPVTEADAATCLSESAEVKIEVKVEVDSKDSKAASATNKSKGKGKKNGEKSSRKHVAEVGENPALRDKEHEEEGKGKGGVDGEVDIEAAIVDSSGFDERNVEVHGPSNIAAQGNDFEADKGGEGEDDSVAMDTSAAAARGASYQEAQTETSQEAEAEDESASRQEGTSASQGLRRGTRVAVAPSNPNACGSTSNIGSRQSIGKKKKSIGKGGKGSNQKGKADPVERESEREKDRERERVSDGSSGPRIRGTDSSPPALGPILSSLPVLSDKQLRSLHLEWVNLSILGVLDRMLSLAEFEAFANSIDGEFLLILAFLILFCVL